MGNAEYMGFQNGHAILNNGAVSVSIFALFYFNIQLSLHKSTWLLRGPVCWDRGRQAEVPQLPRPLPSQAESQVRAGDQLRGQDQTQVQLIRPRAVGHVSI